MKAKRYRKEPPSVEGWYHWKESWDHDPVDLLIAGDERHSEVATASCTARLLGIEYDHNDETALDGYVWAYWEMTSTREMGGLWMLVEAVDLTGKN